MYPGHDGKPEHDFVALDEPPILPPDAQGRFFTLETTDLGSLTRGSPSPITACPSAKWKATFSRRTAVRVTVTAFIRSPWADLVHPETRFWNAGGVDVSLGAQGVRVRANSWQQLLSGGIAFETSTEVLTKPPSPANSDFPLYDNRQIALRAARGPEIVYVAEFEGNQRGVEPGISVELQGNEVGEVKEAHLKYDDAHHKLLTHVTFSIDPDRVSIAGMPKPAGQ